MARQDDFRTTDVVRPAPPGAAVLAVVAVMVAAAVAAGSAGLLGHPLRHALTWGAMAVAILSGGPRRDAAAGAWLALAGAVVLGLWMAAVDLAAVNVLAVALVAAALAWGQRGLSGRLILLAALAAAALGMFRLAEDSIPAVWTAADLLGRTLGRLAGAIAGRPLWLGASFGGVDLLVLMAAFATGWLAWTAPPRWPRAIYAVAAILLGHLGYLVVLAFCGEMLSALPEMVRPPVTTISHLGVWAWSNTVRAMLPWNLPVLAVAIQAIVVAVMLRWATWLPVEEASPADTVGQASGGTRAWFGRTAYYAPVILAAVVPLLTVLGLGRSDLGGKTVVAAQGSFVDWGRPQYDSPTTGGYGMVGPLVESLGGRFVLSPDLSADDLAKADVLLLIGPNQDWAGRPEVARRIWQFVQDGGSLLVAAEPERVRGELRSTASELLDPTAIRVRRDTAVSETIGWEHVCQALAHPATEGVGDRRNRFGLTTPASLDVGLRARPLLVGRWAWSVPGSGGLAAGARGYAPGEKLGDLVLAAEQPVGRGTVVVLGDTSPLHNDLIANSYLFTGRLLGYLARRPVSPQAWWRQWLGLLAAAGCAVMVARRATARRVAAVAGVLAGSLVICTALTHRAGRVVPGAGGPPLALIDASHQEAYATEIWDDFGIGGLARTLMRDGYLPLRVPDVAADRLASAKVLISIAPARAFSQTEQDAVGRFVESGGTFIAMVGAERAAASRELLDSLGFRVPPSPVPPEAITLEPAPVGALYSRYLVLDGYEPTMRFYAAWPVESVAAGSEVLKRDLNNDPVIIRRRISKGNAVVIGDTFFAANENLESATDQLAPNVVFWRWFLPRVTDRETWIPPNPSPPVDPLVEPPEVPPAATDGETQPAQASSPEPDLPSLLLDGLPAEMPPEDPTAGDPADREVAP